MDVLSYHSFTGSAGTEVVVNIKMALVQLLLFPFNTERQRDEVATQLILEFQVFVKCKLVTQRPIVLNDGSREIFRQLYQHGHWQFLDACWSLNQTWDLIMWPWPTVTSCWHVDYVRSMLKCFLKTRLYNIETQLSFHYEQCTSMVMQISKQAFVSIMQKVIILNQSRRNNQKRYGANYFTTSLNF